MQHAKCQATKPDRKYSLLIKKLTETKVSVSDKELWFIFYFKTPSGYIPAANDCLGFIYILFFIINYVNDMCFQNLAEVCNSLSYETE